MLKAAIILAAILTVYFYMSTSDELNPAASPLVINEQSNVTKPADDPLVSTTPALTKLADGPQASTTPPLTKSSHPIEAVPPQSPTLDYVDASEPVASPVASDVSEAPEPQASATPHLVPRKVQVEKDLKDPIASYRRASRWNDLPKDIHSTNMCYVGSLTPFEPDGSRWKIYFYSSYYRPRGRAGLLRGIILKDSLLYALGDHDGTNLFSDSAPFKDAGDEGYLLWLRADLMLQLFYYPYPELPRGGYRGSLYKRQDNSKNFKKIGTIRLDPVRVQEALCRTPIDYKFNVIISSFPQHPEFAMFSADSLAR